MILKTSSAFLALILELFGVYGDGKFKWFYGYVFKFALMANDDGELNSLIMYLSTSKA